MLINFFNIFDYFGFLGFSAFPTFPTSLTLSTCSNSPIGFYIGSLHTVSTQRFAYHFQPPPFVQLLMSDRSEELVPKTLESNGILALFIMKPF